MTDEEKAAKKAADEEAKKKAADEKAAADKAAADKAAAEAKKPKKVRVICDGHLGPELLVKGDETDNPVYVAILEQKGQTKVELVK